MVRKTIAITIAVVIAYVVLAGPLYIYGTAAIIASALASVALVFLTLGLVLATNAYTKRQADKQKR